MYLSRLIIYSTCVWLSSGFPAECLHRGVLQAVRDRKCTISSVLVAPEKGTNMERMAEEKVNLAFLIYFPYSYIFLISSPLCSTYMSFLRNLLPHWCDCVLVSLLCVRYLRVTAWQFCNFPLWLEIWALQDTAERGTGLAGGKLELECF